MKLLINICAHDGIISHFAGVGTIVKKYIKASTIINKDNDYHINLFTPQYNENSFGYSSLTRAENENKTNVTVFIVSNGSNGKTAYGTVTNWELLSKNTAYEINKFDFSKYDYIITIANDTPFAMLPKYINKASNHKIVWIPHSTVKIHRVDSAIKNSELEFNNRLEWEETAINFINDNNNCFLGSTGKYIENHLIEEYNLKKEKSIFIPNGELSTEIPNYIEEPTCRILFEKIKNEKSLIMSYGRAEEYKNLESTMYLGNKMGISSVVITKAYYNGQPIIDDYRKIAQETNSHLFVDVPFNFPHYIINHFNKPIIVLIPSKKEIVGLIINEIRKMNKDNVLIVANNIGGLSEQIEDGKDGILVDLNDINKSSQKIEKFFKKNIIKKINHQSQITLKEKYNFETTMKNFYITLLGDKYE